VSNHPLLRHPSAGLTWTTSTNSAWTHSPALRTFDDSQIAKLTIERGYDKARPRIEVELAALAFMAEANT
jgi:hypothetical protein